jgi:glycosyltransferase involved in cell wall biosynthesis
MLRRRHVTDTESRQRQANLVFAHIPGTLGATHEFRRPSTVNLDRRMLIGGASTWSFQSQSMAKLPQWYHQLPALKSRSAAKERRQHGVTVVVPARNEAANILPVLVRARPFADELMVVDGNSTDGTREIAVACGARVIRDEGLGKGDAIRQAIREAAGDILVFMDADGSHDPGDIPALIQPILEGKADHVSGSRMLGGSDELHATIQQFVRLFGSQVITLSINYTLNVRLTDCQNGFRAIRRDVAADLGLQEDITTIEQEMIIKTLRRGYRMSEVATHEYVRANGESNFRVVDVWSRYLFSLIYYLFLWNPPAGKRL